jgi:glycosyltransferase involved in cell wall biosynthesis
VLKALTSSQKHHYRFFGGHRDVAGIKVFPGDSEIQIHPITFVADEKTRKLSIADYDAIFEDCDALIIIGNPNIKATWSIALRARVQGIKVLFWSHGWLKPENFIKSFIRNSYFRLADRVLVYGERAVDLAEKSSFPRDKVRVIYNSLDFPKQDKVFHELKNIPLPSLRNELSLSPNNPVLLCVSRLTDICHYEWLIEAAANTELRQHSPQLVFIGDGPSKKHLKEMAASLEVNARFLGAIYDEEQIGRYLMAADVVVSPGKVGLTAMHALAFGTPVVTHGNLNTQMPEVEAVEPGISGEYFTYGDVVSLSEATLRLLSNGKTLSERRNACRDIILRKYTPEVQARLIDEAIDEVV